MNFCGDNVFVSFSEVVIPQFQAQFQASDKIERFTVQMACVMGYEVVYSFKHAR